MNRRRRRHPAAVSRIAVATTSVAATVVTMAGFVASANAEAGAAPLPAPTAVQAPDLAWAPGSASALTPAVRAGSVPTQPAHTRSDAS
jgi:hypothetical protein